MSKFLWLGIVGGVLLMAGCRHAATLKPVTMAEGAYPELHNLLRVTDGVYSGGEPRGAAAFDDLKRLGIRTVVSVDGATPDVAAAKARGMRYVHVPIGYDGVPEAAALALTRALKEADGPVYFHCHHGRHRGPAGVAVACIGAGLTDNDGGRRILEVAGTSGGYAGLWRDVAAFRAPGPEVELPELVEKAEVADFAAAMAAADRAYDALKLCQAAGWRTPVAHPDLSPEQQALLLWEGMRESKRHSPAKDDPRFSEWMAEGEALADGLRESLAAGERDFATAHFKKIQISCKQCHGEYRN